MSRKFTDPHWFQRRPIATGDIARGIQNWRRSINRDAPDISPGGIYLPMLRPYGSRLRSQYVSYTGEGRRATFAWRSPPNQALSGVASLICDIPEFPDGDLSFELRSNIDFLFNSSSKINGR